MMGVGIDADMSLDAAMAARLGRLPLPPAEVDVIAAGGGMAVAADGAMKALLPLPLSGLVSKSPLEETAEGFARVRTAMNAAAECRPPYLVFKACFGATLACNAGTHLTDRGVADGETGMLLATPALEILG